MVYSLSQVPLYYGLPSDERYKKPSLRKLQEKLFPNNPRPRMLTISSYPGTQLNQKNLSYFA